MLERYVVAVAGVVAIVVFTPSCTDVERGTPMAVGSSFVVTPPIASYVRDLDAHERRDQIRDWAVLATVARQAATPEQAAAATYEIPPARLAYLDELYAFEYGRGRRAYLGDRVLLFRDGDDRDPQATIGRLADRVRMENGELPAAAEVYLVHDNRDDGEIRVDRIADVSRGALLSSDYGYVEGEAGDLKELSAWLSRADDLAFIEIASDGRLRLGGRRFAATPTRNVTVEDVAALYQAHEQLDAPHAAARARLATLSAPARTALTRLVALGQDGKLDEDSAAPYLRVLARSRAVGEIDDLLAAQVELEAAQSPGFSLDPRWLPSPGDPERPLLRDALRAFIADPCADLRAIIRKAKALAAEEPDDTRHTEQGAFATAYIPFEAALQSLCKQLAPGFATELERILDGLDHASPSTWNTALAPLHELRSRKSKTMEDSIIDFALNFHMNGSQVQCARYEGLAGTEVGMTLFYTDLLAKLWAGLDWGLSAPTLEIPGFLAAPRIDLPETFQQSVIDNPYTRLWFGPRPGAVSRKDIDTGAEFYFSHTYSRIYAAGSNPARPGIEVKPAEQMRRTLGWWDRHFDAVADFEPQYHRQNQIMKWSLITAALLDRPSTSLAGQLHAATVDRTATFATWLHGHREQLRFAEALPAPAGTISGRECIPIVSSYPFKSEGRMSTLTGGVSTATRAAPRATSAIDAALPLGARRAIAIERGPGTAARAHPERLGTRVHFASADEAVTHAPTGPVKLGMPHAEYQRGAQPGALVIRSGNGPTSVGELAIAPQRNSRIVEMRFDPGPVEREVRGELEVLDSLAKADAAAKDGHLVEAARVYREKLPAAVTTDDMARTAVVDAVAGRPNRLLADLRKFERLHKLQEASAAVRPGLVRALEDRASSAVARRLEDMLEHGGSLDGGGEIVAVIDGRLGVTRDITAASPAARIQRARAIDLSDGKIYVDDRVRAAYEGALFDDGGRAARWHRIRGVQIDELRDSPIGALPDRLVLPGDEQLTAPARAPRGQMTVPTTQHIYLIRRCDPDHSTPAPDDDCPRAATQP